MQFLCRVLIETKNSVFPQYNSVIHNWKPLIAASLTKTIYNAYFAKLIDILRKHRVM